MSKQSEMASVTDGPYSHDGKLIGHPEPQARAVEILIEDGPMEYDELKDRLGLPQDEMQSLIRHLTNYNGLIKRTVRSDGGHHGFVATPNERIEPYIDT